MSKALSCIPALFACAKRLKRRTEAFKKCYLFRTVTSAAQAVWEISPQECLSSSAPGVVPEQEARSGAKPSLRTLVPFKRHCAELRGTALKSGRPECLGKEGKKKKKKRWKLSSYQSNTFWVHRSDWKLSLPLHLSAGDFKRYVSESHSFCLGMEKDFISFSPEDMDFAVYAAAGENTNLEQQQGSLGLFFLQWEFFWLVTSS